MTNDRHQRVGLVCSGGGARGFFHLGFLHRLSQHGLRPDDFDCLCGVSGGALAMYPFACGMDMSLVVELATRHLAASTFWSRLPGVKFAHLFRLLRGRLSRLMRRHLPTVQLESLSTKLIIASFDVAHGVPHPHEKGDGIDAVSASMAVPFMSRPKRMGDRVLIDGGAWCNLPAQLIRDHAQLQQVIGVDASCGAVRQGASASRFGLFDIAFRTWWSQRRQEEARQREACELLVAPQLGRFSFTDFSRKAISQLIDLGREAADKAAPEIIATLATKSLVPPPSPAVSVPLSLVS